MKFLILALALNFSAIAMAQDPTPLKSGDQRVACYINTTAWRAQVDLHREISAGAIKIINDYDASSNTYQFVLAKTPFDISAPTMTYDTQTNFYNLCVTVTQK